MLLTNNKKPLISTENNKMTTSQNIISLRTSDWNRSNKLNAPIRNMMPVNK